MPHVPPKNVSTLITMCEYSRKGMRVLTQVDESTYVIHRLYEKNRHSKLITHNWKTLPHVWADASVCMCQRFSMCKPIHTYVFAIGCIIFRRNLLKVSRNFFGAGTTRWLHHSCHRFRDESQTVKSRLQECKQMIEILWGGGIGNKILCFFAFVTQRLFFCLLVWFIFL